ncbi:MAG: tetratricopeptide repeat protein [Acidobacteriota bacterium]|nr:tetratricopeptide repeat protein [Acidobacteriota bacterium]
MTANEDSNHTCKKCGARLMLIGKNMVWEEPESNARTVSMDDHFLERISNLEETVSGVLENMARLADTLEVLDRNGFVTRSGLSALVDTLRESNLLREELLYERWETTMVEQMEEARFRDRFVQLRGRFLALYRGESTKKTAFLAYIDEAEFLIFSDRINESIEVLTAALDLDDQNYELAYYLAECCQLQGLNQIAMALLETAIEANPEHSDSLLLLGLMYYGNNDIEPAREMLIRCIEVSPHQPLALLSMGSILTGEGKFDEARPFLERAVELEPGAQGYYLLGLSARENGKLKEAIDFLGYATELDPEHEDAVFALGMTYLKRGWTRKARACFARALELNPNRVEFREAAGYEEPPEPEVEASLDGDSAKTLEMAHTLFQEGKLKQALPHYRQLLRRYPANYLFLSAFSVLNFSLRRFDESLKAAGKILELDVPETVRCVAFTMEMECLRAQGRYDDAIEVAGRMLNEFPEGYGRAVACYGLALTNADTGRNLREAEALAKEALRVCAPDFRHNVMDALGWVYFKQGRLEEALDLLKSAISMRETLNHLYHYGMILLALNLQEEAFKIYERIVKLRKKNNVVDDFIFAAIRREMDSQSAETE